MYFTTNWKTGGSNQKQPQKRFKCVVKEYADRIVF